MNLKPIWFEKTKVLPSKIVCIGRNYQEHIEELNNEVSDGMVFFLKPNSAISETLVAATDESLHFESELCFLVKGQQFIAVGFGFDLTKRALQSRLKAKGLPWERAKAFDGAALFSEFVPFNNKLDELSLEMRKDGQMLQEGGVSAMISKPAQILEEIQSFMSLNDGDVVMTGTPKGVGKLVAGCSYTGRIYADKQLLCEQLWNCQ